jgi:3-keto-L-gulonate-6-phosphate decarboxylase
MQIYSEVMKAQKYGNKVQINFLISKELDKKWREYVQRKYGIYHRGILTESLEQAIRQFIGMELK